MADVERNDERSADEGLRYAARYSEQTEIDVRNLLAEYVGRIKDVFLARDFIGVARSLGSARLCKAIDWAAQQAFDESTEIARRLGDNPLINDAAPNTLYDIKEDATRPPEERKFFNPFLELLDETRERFDRKWYKKTNAEVVDALMKRLYKIEDGISRP